VDPLKAQRWISHTPWVDPTQNLQHFGALTVRTHDDTVTLRGIAPTHGDPPPDGPPGVLDRLWEHEVLEFFWVGSDGAYLELEFGPHEHYLVLQLSGPRQLVRSRIPLPLVSFFQQEGHWSVEARLPAALWPTPPWRAAAFAIHGVAPRRHYRTSQPLPGPRPDFHQPDVFASFAPAEGPFPQPLSQWHAQMAAQLRS